MSTSLKSIIVYYYYMNLAHVHDRQYKVWAKRYNQSKSVDVDRLLIKFSCTQIVKSVLLESLEYQCAYPLRVRACWSTHLIPQYKLASNIYSFCLKIHAASGLQLFSVAEQANFTWLENTKGRFFSAPAYLLKQSYKRTLSDLISLTKA